MVLLSNIKINRERKARFFSDQASVASEFTPPNFFWSFKDEFKTGFSFSPSRRRSSEVDVCPSFAVFPHGKKKVKSEQEEDVEPEPLPGSLEAIFAF